MGLGQRGALIVIEGVDRSGKSTQCKKLIQSLEKLNIKCNLITFPDRNTSTGKLIDEYLKNAEYKLSDQAIHLLFSANRWENVEKMKSLLLKGVTLVVDRYSYSGIVFSAVKKNMSIEWCQQPEIGLLKPDIVILLTLGHEEMISRPGFGKERYESAEFQKNVAKLYEQLCDETDNWIKINAAGSIDEIQQEILKASLEKINKEKSPLETLNFNMSK